MTRIIFRSPTTLLDDAREDLARRHPFAAERVGWLAVKPAMAGEALLLLGHSYHPVADHHYVRDPSVGAMIGEDAITAALTVGRRDKVGMFHIHTHCGTGVPEFSHVDLREHPKLVFDFFSIQRGYPHGALLLSDDAMMGLVWFSRKIFQPVDEVHLVGSTSRVSFPERGEMS
jgi:hypothetical protein